MTTAPTYDWWLSALELAGDYGVLTREQMYTLGVHEDEPQPGFYRVPPPKRRLRDDDPIDDAWVAIWPTDNGLAALWNGEPTEPCAAWAWCCKAPVSEERYRKMEMAGFPAGEIQTGLSRW